MQDFLPANSLAFRGKTLLLGTETSAMTEKTEASGHPFIGLSRMLEFRFNAISSIAVINFYKEFVPVKNSE
jgi:hypothetical protein